jgi:hypothetical protein
MALPSSGPLSFQDIGTELGVNPPLSLAAMSTTAGFTAPFAVTDFYGYGGGAPDVVTSGLVLYLDAGQTTSYSGSGSTWTDLSGYGNNATLVNNPTFSSSYGGNLQFPYSNVYGQINDAASLQFGTGDFTISLWEYPIVVNDGSNQRTILSKNYTGFEIFIYQSILRGYFGGVNQLIGTTTLTANIWYNFVFVRSAGVITSYINTIQDGQYAYAGDVSNIGTGLYINIRPSTPYYGEQNMSNILLYNRALTNSEVVQNYNAFASRFSYTPLPITSGLTLLLDAKNTSSYSGSGTSWNDVSGNNNNGTFNVAPTYNAGGYFQLNGTELVQSFPSSISPTLSSKTIIVWFNIADTTRRGLIATRDSASNGGWAFVVNRTATGNLTFFNISGGLIEKAAGITPSNWYMATLTYNYSTLEAELFVNGISVGTQSSVGAGSNVAFNGVVAAEQENDFGGAFAGGYSIVNIYNRVLTSSEIIFNYNAYASRFGLTPIPSPIQDGLVLYLDAGNPSSYSGSGSTWTDLSVEGNNGTLMNVPTFDSGNGGSLLFNGSNQYADLGNPASLNILTWTIGTWTKSISFTNYQNIIAKGDNTAGQYGIIIDGSGNWAVQPNTAFNTTPLSLGSWNYIVGISDGSQITTYINGILVAQYSMSSSNHGTGVQVGTDLANNRYFNGNIAISQIYNRVLSGAEIIFNYNAFAARFGL